MAEKASLPNAANFRLRIMKLLMRYAVEHGWTRDDPTVGIRKFRIKPDGYHTWEESEIVQFEERWPVGTKQRLAFDLLLRTGQRSADVRQMTRANLASGIIRVRQQKTNAQLEIPISPGLAASLAMIPSEQFMLLQTSFGKPFTEKGFGNFVKGAADTAGLTHCSVHGLRKSAARRLAEAGCTEHEIMAITGQNLP